MERLIATIPFSFSLLLLVYVKGREGMLIDMRSHFLHQKEDVKVNRHKTLFILLVIPLILVSFIVVYTQIIGNYPFENFLRKNSITHGNKGMGIEDPGADNIIVEFKEVFNECGHEELIKKELISISFGLSVEELEERYPDWTLREFSQNTAVFFRTQDGFCQEDMIYKHISIKDGYVTVFYGRPRTDAIVVKTTKINAKYLPTDEIKNLENGIVITDDAELLLILEGLSSLQPF